jgi:putative SOS response-associated peptidase YedK
MCGRFALDTDTDAIREQLGAELIELLPNSFNVAPTENCLVVTLSEQGRIAQVMTWGIQPWYNPKQLLINARIESAHEKSAFKQAFNKRRCLLLFNGFFEWQHHVIEEKTVKQPYFIQRQDQKLMAIAAIWEKGNLQNPLPSCCLMTTMASPVVAPLHDRMPLIVSLHYMDAWLSNQPLEATLLSALLEDDQRILLTSYPVTTAVNKNDYKAANTTKPL